MRSVLQPVGLHGLDLIGAGLRTQESPVSHGPTTRMEAKMITIGVDAHKTIHVALAVAEAGKEMGDWQGPNSEAGWRSLASWAAALGECRQWGIEGAWGYGRGLAQHLVLAGETVYEINARWTAMRRRSAHKPGKTDQLDASAIALFVRQDPGDL